ncbi:MAG: SUMF1/EgtB/PvdO family nonheme iron enzyme [Bacteroidales bacterium]|nr:SUMF1/EgtB/PvdO family nonheme iron enzyme [Bacteroidales bacterium]
MKSYSKAFCQLILVSTIFVSCHTGTFQKHKSVDFVNNQGTEMIYIPAGTFMMGNTDTLPDSLMPGDRYNELHYLKPGDSDERPLREVSLTNGFHISKTEITVAEFRKFRPGFMPSSDTAVYVEGISWYDAVEYCEWLSEKEGTTYRLPTEAEWEHVAKSNLKYQVINMASLPAEWCLDWYAPYPYKSQEDPAGPQSGLSKVIRGGGLDKQTPFFFRPANRASMAPSFPPVSYIKHQQNLKSRAATDEGETENNMSPENLKSETRYLNFIREAENNQGNHHIGFRIVKAPYPQNHNTPNPKFPAQAVKNNMPREHITGPYFKKRLVLPTPPENIPDGDIKFIGATGLNKHLLTHNHCPALAIMPNGDAFMAIFSSVSETAHDVKIICTRLRYGADEWDMPEVLVDFADANDHAPLLWQEGDTTRLYWGNNKYEAGFPFQWIESYDYGQTWTEPEFPVFKTPVGAHSAQPITAAFRDNDNNIYVSSDGVGPTSVLWRSEDNGKTWMDPGGRTAGRHTAFVQLKDGTILGMGGKSSQINGFMPKSISKDKGKTWEVSASPFIAQGPGQRPSILRLKSGRLVMAGDMSSRLTDELARNRPAVFKERGCYVAWSDDEGITWSVKKLPETQYAKFENDKLNDHTLGYTVLRQGPNENIHLIGTIAHPVFHFEFNEAWLLNEEASEKHDQNETQSLPLEKAHSYTEFYESGKPKASYSFQTLDNGLVKLHGTEIWYYPDGKKMYEVQYASGKKTGREIFRDESGRIRWERNYHDNGLYEHISRWDNGVIKTTSWWKNKRCVGTVQNFDREGNLTVELEYVNGRIKNGK